MEMELITSVAMGVALSACCGFRVFIPLLGASFAAWQNWYQLPPDMQWMGTVPAFVAFAAAALLEIAAYYIPVVDHFLDAIAAPLALGAGTVLAASFLPIADWSPMWKWLLALLAGGGAAGTIHMGTGLVRLASTKMTATLGNPVLATSENALAISGTVLSFIVPVLVAVIMLVLVGWVLLRGLRKMLTRF